MADLLSYALTTVADVKESLGISSGNNSKNNLIIRKINQATLMIEGYCGLSTDHHFKQTTYTNEEYDGSGSNALILKMSPVSSLTSFQNRATSENQDDWDDIETEHYFLDSAAGVIDLLFTQTNNFNKYRLTYTAGYSTIPADLAEACATLAAYLVENSTPGSAIKSKQEGSRSIEYAVSLSEKDIFEQLGIEDMVNKYIRYAISDV